MSELEEKLNQLLENPDAMSRIFSLAKQLENGAASPSPSESTESDLDMDLLRRIMPILREWKRPNTQSIQLLQALKPYMKEEKQGKINRALQLARLIHIGKKLIMEGGSDLV